MADDLFTKISNTPNSPLSGGILDGNNFIKPPFSPQSTGPSVSGGPTSSLMTVAQNTLSNTNIIKYFYSMLYDKSFQPDINGFVLIYLLPPDLSGYNLSPNSSFLGNVGKMSVFLAESINLPLMTVTTEQISGGETAISSASNVESSAQFSVTYLDDSSLSVFSLHKLWVDYIRDCIRGNVIPDPSYYKDDFIELDYATSIYVIKFKPCVINSANDFYDNVVYIGKIFGVFPINIPDADIIGRRQSNELTIETVNYCCTTYRQWSPFESLKNLSSENSFDWIMSDFKNDCDGLYA